MGMGASLFYIGNSYFEFKVKLGGENTKNWKVTVRLIKQNKLPHSSRIYEKYSKTAYDDLFLSMSKQPISDPDRHFYTKGLIKRDGFPSNPEGNFPSLFPFSYLSFLTFWTSLLTFPLSNIFRSVV